MTGSDAFPKPEAVPRQEKVGEYRGTVTEMEAPDRKQAIFHLKLPARWIMWARTAKDASVPAHIQDRVCIGRIMDDGIAIDAAIPQRTRAILVRKFFDELPGTQVSFGRAYDSGANAYNKAIPDSLPEQFRAETFSDILSWYMKNRPDVLKEVCKPQGRRRSKA